MPFDLHPEVQVLVLSEDGDRIGTMRVRQALELARDQGLDLVVISRQSNSIVCKVMDEGKWKYQQKKKQKQQQKKALAIKEVKFGISTQQHDVEIKTKHIREFINKGHHVRVVVEMHGRERAYSDVAKDKLAAIITSLGDAVQPGGIKALPNSVFTTLQPTRYKNGEGNETSPEGSSSNQQSAC
jgi:translation initiation factor IF-3